jgi:hypothetical protein
MLPILNMVANNLLASLQLHGSHEALVVHDEVNNCSLEYVVLNCILAEECDCVKEFHGLRDSHLVEVIFIKASIYKAFNELIEEFL